MSAETCSDCGTRPKSVRCVSEYCRYCCNKGHGGSEACGWVVKVDADDWDSALDLLKRAEAFFASSHDIQINTYGANIAKFLDRLGAR